jgi:N-acetylglucosaminyl-diphospho-decaprenol L-rhamnosyltransferase
MTPARTGEPRLGRASAAAPEPGPSAPLTVRAVILTHGPGDEFVPLLRSLLKQGLPASSVVVAHNPLSEDEPPLRPWVDGVHVVRTSGRMAYSGGMNSGIRFHLSQGQGAHLLVLTRDVVLHDGAIPALLDIARSAKPFGILGPRAFWKGPDVFTYGGFLTSTGETGHHQTPLQPDSAGITPCDWIDGSAMLIREEVLSEVGLFDDSFFMYYEDADLCLRAARAGWRVGVALDSTVSQEPGMAHRPSAFSYLMARNGLEFARRVAGLRGLASALGRLARSDLGPMRDRLRRAGSSEERAAAKLLMVARHRGVVDYALGRWGPPPATLAGLGDMADRNP